MPSRRRVLASLATVAGVAAAGCTRGDTTGTTTSPPTTEPATTHEPTESTTSGLPENCRTLPDVDGLPDAPSEWTLDRAESYATDFERAYYPTTDDYTTGIASLQVTETEATDGQYVVKMTVEVETDTSGTQTERPQDAVEHRAWYVLAADRVVRQQRGIPSKALLDEVCWQLPENGE